MRNWCRSSAPIAACMIFSSSISKRRELERRRNERSPYEGIPELLMPIRSMTGFAQVKGQVGGDLAFTLSLKAVNHKFLDLHFRLPANSDLVEASLRRVLKEKLARGHVDVNLSFDQSGASALTLNRQLVAAYVKAFRTAAAENGIVAEPD